MAASRLQRSSSTYASQLSFQLTRADACLVTYSAVNSYLMQAPLRDLMIVGVRFLTFGVVTPIWQVEAVKRFRAPKSSGVAPAKDLPGAHDQTFSAFLAKRSGRQAVCRLIRAVPVDADDRLPATHRSAFGFCYRSRGYLSPSSRPHFAGAGCKPDACRRSFSCRFASSPEPCRRNNVKPHSPARGLGWRLPSEGLQRRQDRRRG
jgi:hypothetical protein